MENARDSIVGDGGELSIKGIATYQPFDGLLSLKVVSLILSIVYLIE